MKTQQHTCMHTTYKVSIRCTSLCLNKTFIYTWYWIVKFFQDIWSYTIPCFTYSLLHRASHSRLYISSFKHGSWLPIFFFIIFQTFSMELISGKFPGYFRTGISLHSRNVLALLDLWNGARSCIKIYPFCGNIAHSH